MDRQEIVPAQGPDRLAERCARPFTLEALRLLTERVATVAEIDQICRLGAGCATGPFQLIDEIGLDVALEAARCAYAESFGEPRWQPSPVIAELVAAGRLGRTSGAGFYDYAEPGPQHTPDPDPPSSGGGEGVVVIAGDSLLAETLLDAGAGAGWEMLLPDEAHGAPAPFLIVDLTGGADSDDAPLQGGPRAVCCVAGSLAALEQGGTAVGFHALAPFEATQLVELTRGPDSAASAARAAEQFFATLGRQTVWVGDAPGLVLGRIFAQLVNEAAFALGEGIGSAAGIDAAVKTALGTPLGPLQWADQIGLEQILGTLDALHDERREERYRPAPELTHRLWTGRLGIQTGEGFYTYG
jgi:3-hydroxybutyryl-CoA dehydrogenase